MSAGSTIVSLSDEPSTTDASIRAPSSDIGVERHLASRLRPAALLIIVLVALGFPAMFAALEYRALTDVTQVRGRDLARPLDGMPLLADPVSSGAILRATALVFVLSAAVGIALGVFVYLFPTRVVRRAEARIRGLIDEHQRLYRDAERRLAEMARLAALCGPLASSLELEHVLDHVAEAALELIGVDVTRLWTVDETAGIMRVRAMRAAPGRELPTDIPNVLPIGAGIVGDVLVTKTAHYSADLRQEPLLRHIDWPIRYGFVSQLSIPLLARDRVVGVLSVVTKSPRTFTEEERQLLTIFGSKAAAALDNARLYETARQTMRELASRNAELDSFVYSVSHDLKAPLVAIQGMAGALAEDCRSQLDDRGRHYLERLHANVDTMERLIADLLTLSRVGRDTPPADTVALRAVVGDVLRGLAHRIERRRITVVVGELPVVHGVGTHLAQVFTNLVDNAIKYMGDGPASGITIGGVTRDGWAECFVSDTGIGIDPAYHARVFEVFQRLKDVDVEGSGVGLTIVKKIVDTVGGRVWIESSRGRGTTVRFTWPAAERPDHPVRDVDPPGVVVAAP